MSAEASKLCKPTDRTRAGGRQPPGRWVAVRWARGSLLGQQTGFGNRRWLDSTVNRVAHFFFLKKQTTSVLLNKTAGRKHAHGYSGHGLGGCCPNTTVLLWLVGGQHSSWPDPPTSSCRTRRESKHAGHTASEDAKRLSLPEQNPRLGHKCVRADRNRRGQDHVSTCFTETELYLRGL